MVVRSLIGAVVNRLPYTDRLPQFVHETLKEDTDSYKLAKLDSPLASSSDLGAPLSPQQKIHNRILRKREPVSPPGSSDGFLLQEPLMPDHSDALTESETVDGGVESSKQRMVQKYLDEQNAKFDSLINKNLNVVLQQQSMFEDEASWQQLMVDLAMSRDKDEISKKMTSLMGRASGWIQSHLPGSRSSSTSASSSRPISGGAITEADSCEQTDAVVRADDATIENFLDSLDYQTKINLLRQLRVDLGISDLDDLSKFSRELSLSHRGTPTLLIDKVETLMIISVRLSFICFKFMIPMATYMYLKFKNNDVLFFNNKNFNRLLSLTIKFMESLEAKLKAETLNAYKYGEGGPENVPQTIEAPPERAYPSIEAEASSPPPVQETKATWTETFTKMAINYWVRSKSSKADYVSDPRYAQYFSGKRDSGEIDGDDRNDNFNLDQHELSFIEIAQQFADQLK